MAGGATGEFDGQFISRFPFVTDIFITKYNSDGTRDWSRLVGARGASFDDITTAVDGSIYITGYMRGAFDGQINNGDYDAFITKYSADGTKLWTRFLGGIYREQSSALVTDANGDVYVAGSTDSPTLDGQVSDISNSDLRDAFITKYSGDGTKLWTKLLGGGSVGGNGGFGLTIGNDQSVYFGGIIQDENFDGQFLGYSDSSFLRKYQPDGTELWTRILTGNDDVGELDALDVSTGLNGFIYVSGATKADLDGQINNGDNDAFITKYSPDGNKIWTQLLGSTESDLGYSLAHDNQGSFYLNGRTRGDLDGQTNNGGFDIFITKFTESIDIINTPPEDGNGDGIPDNEQENVVNVGTTTLDYVTVVIPDGQSTNDITVEAIANPAPDTTPPELQLEQGFFDVDFTNVNPLETTTITLYLPAGSNANTYYKYGPTPDNNTPHWYEFLYDSATDTGAKFEDVNGDGQDEIILHFVDGARGDDDLTVNGVISDPGAPAFDPNLDLFNLDIDGDGDVSASIDGLLAYGYLNIRGIGVDSLVENLTQQLADNLINPNGTATRDTGAEIRDYLESNIEYLDIDKD